MPFLKFAKWVPGQNSWDIPGKDFIFGKVVGFPSLT